MRVRNYFFDKGWIESVAFNLPLIAVGNLSVGGTGKSPMIEYLIRQLRLNHDLAVLSRGYGRRTKGYILAKKGTSAEQIGDEPYQFFRKFEDLQVAVDEDRVRGVSNLLVETPCPEVILLDDAYQHRRIKAGLYVLMTSFDKLYSEDLVLPAGDLREPAAGAKRADLIVVSKCPLNLPEAKKLEIRKRLGLRADQQLYFTGIEYMNRAMGSEKSISMEELSNAKVLLVTGIANPRPMIEYLKELGADFRHMEFPDHHTLTQKEHKSLKKALEMLEDSNSIILTTEKDFVRNFEQTKDLPVYFLPIEMVFLEEEERFIQTINDYVRKNKGNS